MQVQGTGELESVIVVQSYQPADRTSRERVQTIHQDGGDIRPYTSYKTIIEIDGQPVVDTLLVLQTGIEEHQLTAEIKDHFISHNVT